METKGLFTAITNIVEEEVTQPFSYFVFTFLFQSLAQFFEMQSLEPLSNFALRVALFSHLQKLVYKEPNLKELIVKEVKRLEPRIILYFECFQVKVGLDDLKEFDAVTNLNVSGEEEFVRENVVRSTWLYHRSLNHDSSN